MCAEPESYTSRMAFATIAIAIAIVAIVFPTTVVAQEVGISVSPSSISRSLSTTSSTAVTVTNNINATMHIIITKGGGLDLSVYPSEFDLNPLSSRTVTLTLSPGTYSGKIYYFWSWVNGSGVVDQNINVVRAVRVEVFPENIDVNLVENETLDYPVILSNPTSHSVSVNITPYGSVVAGVSEAWVSIPAGGFTNIFVTVKGLNGAGEVRYTVHYPSTTETITQSVDVYAYRPKAREYTNLQNQIKELKNELQLTKAKFYLPDRIKVEMSKAAVGEPITVTVTGMVNGTWIPLEGVVVSIGDELGLTNTHGSTQITLNKAGTYDVRVYDRLGGVKYSQVLSVKKGEIELKIPEIKLGKPFRLDLPEEGELTIYKGKVKFMVLKADSNTNITIGEPGKYNFTFSSKSYHGSAETVIRDKIRIVAVSNGIQLKPGSSIKAGDVILVTFKYSSGKPAKVDAQYQVIPESGKVDKEKMFDILMMQMLSSYYSDTGTDIMLPTFGKISDTSTIQIVAPEEGGILTIKAEGGSYAEGSSLMLTIKPNTPNPITAAIPFLIIGITTSVFAYKASPRFREAVNNSKIGSKLKKMRRGGVEPPI